MPEHGHENGSGQNHGTDYWIDRRVLEGVRRRESDALGRFFDVTLPYVYNLAFRLTGNRHNAEDVAQDVFLKIHRAADRLDAGRDPKPWITTITYNACRDLARRNAAKPEDAVNGATIDEYRAPADNPEEALLKQERNQAVERALRELDDQSRAVVILFSYCGHSHDEIADIIGTSHAAVRKRYSRALKQMAQTVQGLLG